MGLFWQRQGNFQCSGGKKRQKSMKVGKICRTWLDRPPKKSPIMKIIRGSLMSDQSVNNKSQLSVAINGIVIIAIVLVLSFILAFVPLPMTCPPCGGKGGSEWDWERYRETRASNVLCSRCKGSGTEYRVYGVRTYTTHTDKHTPPQ